MYKLLIALALTVIPSVTIAAGVLPTPNRSGDFVRRTSHKFWLVVDNDPQGLNCRWSASMPTDWYAPNAKFPTIAFSQLPVVKRFKKQAVLTANTTPAGFATLFDRQKKPWLKVSLGANDRICLVRANTKFIQPIQR